MSGNNERTPLVDGRNWSHRERVLFARDMIRNGATDNELVRFFSRFTDFDERITRHQLRLIRYYDNNR